MIGLRIIQVCSAILPPSACGGVPDTMACTDDQCYCLDGKQMVFVSSVVRF